MANLLEERSAYFSADRKYRYWLKIVWNPDLPLLIVIGLNPSTADELKDDPTVRKCKEFARRLHCGGLLMLNIFSFRATKPEVMMLEEDPIGPENNRILLEHVCSRTAFITIAAWGVNGVHRKRCYEVESMLKGRLRCLRITPKTGHPEHPLYIPYATELVDFYYA